MTFTYLTFHQAEKAKRAINTEDLIHIQDILGFDHEIPKEEMIAAIHPVSLEFSTINFK